MAANQDRFQTLLAGHFQALFGTDPRYSYVMGRTTPLELAAKMTAALAKGVGFVGEGVRLTCQDLKIRPVGSAIQRFLTKDLA